MSKLFTEALGSNIFWSLLVIVGLSGCADHHSSDSVPPAQQTTKQQVNSCDLTKENLNEGTAKAQAQEQVITVERHYQRVVRKDCAGKVTSDEVETVKSPHYDLTFKAPIKRKFRSVFIFNENSCDNKLTTMPISNFPILGLLNAVTGDGESKISIKGDMANALLTFKLEEGKNKIFVQYFYDCSPESVPGSTTSVGTSDCKESRDSLIVEYPVSVAYVLKKLDGVKEIVPLAESCKTIQNK